MLGKMFVLKSSQTNCESPHTRGVLKRAGNGLARSISAQETVNGAVVRSNSTNCECSCGEVLSNIL